MKSQLVVLNGRYALRSTTTILAVGRSQREHSSRRLVFEERTTTSVLTMMILSNILTPFRNCAMAIKSVNLFVRVITPSSSWYVWTTISVTKAHVRGLVLSTLLIACFLLCARIIIYSLQQDGKKCKRGRKGSVKAKVIGDGDGVEDKEASCFSTKKKKLDTCLDDDQDSCSWIFETPGCPATPAPTPIAVASSSEPTPRPTKAPLPRCPKYDYKPQYNSACRTGSGGRGEDGDEYDLYSISSYFGCETICNYFMDKCKAFEYSPHRHACEIWKEMPAKTEHLGGTTCSFKGSFSPYPGSCPLNMYGRYQNRACRTINNGKGSDGHEYKLYEHIVSSLACEAICTHSKSHCFAFEYNYHSKHCEIWKQTPFKFEFADNISCNVNRKVIPRQGNGNRGGGDDDDDDGNRSGGDDDDDDGNRSGGDDDDDDGNRSGGGDDDDDGKHKGGGDDD